jgi:hypothetical protein
MFSTRLSVPDASDPVSTSDVSGQALLRLSRANRDAARERLRGLPDSIHLQACLDIRPESRSEFLMLLDNPESVVQSMPETEFCVTVRATGMSEAPSLLAMATPDQIQTCFDLDCWDGADLSQERLIEWWTTLVEAGEGAMRQALQAVDPELLVLVARAVVEVRIIAKDETAPEGWFTIDGSVHFGPRERVDPGFLNELLVQMFHEDPARYWQLVYGLLFELQAECEEDALRWRTGRLADLGFPELDQAMRVYRRLEPEDAPAWEIGAHSEALVPTHPLPRKVAGTLLGEALAKLSPQRASDVLGYVLSVSNAIAVADGLSLSASESIPKAVEKTVRGIDRALRELAQLRGVPVHEVLETTLPLDLFRIGATLDPDLRRS